MYYIAIQPALEGQHHIKYWQLLKILVQQNLSIFVHWGLPTDQPLNIIHKS